MCRVKPYLIKTIKHAMVGSVQGIKCNKIKQKKKGEAL